MFCGLRGWFDLLTHAGADEAYYTKHILPAVPEWTVRKPPYPAYQCLMQF